MEMEMEKTFWVSLKMKSSLVYILVLFSAQVKMRSHPRRCCSSELRINTLYPSASSRCGSWFDSGGLPKPQLL